MKNILRYISAILLSVVTAVTVDAQPAKAQVENYVLSAIHKYNSGDYDAAIKMLHSVVENDRNNDAACYYLALSYIQKNDLDLAEAFLQRATESDPSNFWYRQRLATLYSVTSRAELAIDIYEKLLEDFPKKSDIYFELVELYASQQLIDKALETIEKVETIFGVTETLAVYRYNLLKRADRQKEAIRSLEEYNEKYSSPYVLSVLADWHISMYNDSTALTYYNEALELDSEYAPAQVGKAEVLRMRRDYNGFFSTLDRFVKNKNTPTGGKTDYVKAIVQQADPKFLRMFTPQIDTLITHMAETHPSDSATLELAGIWFFSSGNKEKTLEYFKKNMHFHPESIAITAGYVDILMFYEMWDELAVEGRKAFEVFANEPAFLEMASIGDYNMKRYDEVLEICDRVLELAPTDSSKTLRAWSTKGDVYHLQGETKKAYKAYDRALKINPNYIYVLNNYAYYLSEEGKQLKKAYEMSKKTIESEPDNATYLDTFGWIIYLQGRPMEAKPFFKRAMLHGGKDSAVILDHYAEVLFALKEYDRAFVYWNMAKQKNVDGSVENLEEKIKQKKMEAGR